METRKALNEMSFIEIGELVLRDAGKWRGAAIIELAQYQHEEQGHECLIRVLNAMWWGVTPEEVIDELLQGFYFPDDNVVEGLRSHNLEMVYS